MKAKPNKKPTQVIYEKTCIVCGQDFTAKQYTAKTCSQKCRNALSISRKIAGNENLITDDIPVTTPENIEDMPVSTSDKTDVMTGKNTSPVKILNKTDKIPVITSESPKNIDEPPVITSTETPLFTDKDITVITDVEPEEGLQKKKNPDEEWDDYMSVHGSLCDGCGMRKFGVKERLKFSFLTYLCFDCYSSGKLDVLYKRAGSPNCYEHNPKILTTQECLRKEQEYGGYKRVYGYGELPMTNIKKKIRKLIEILTIGKTSEQLTEPKKWIPLTEEEKKDCGKGGLIIAGSKRRCY